MIRAALLLLVACDTAPPASGEATELGYSIGFQVGDDFRRMNRSIDPAAVEAGLRDALEQRDPALPADEQERVLKDLQLKEKLLELDSEASN